MNFQLNLYKQIYQPIQFLISLQIIAINIYKKLKFKIYLLKTMIKSNLNYINEDKILERQENGNTFIIHVLATPQYLQIQIQDKFKGDIWCQQFTAKDIVTITSKTPNPKDYPTFIKMLMSSLQGTTESVIIEILSYAQLQRKMNANSKNRNLQQNNKKYFIMTYIEEFGKSHYPLALLYQQQPSVQRLKMTIRRLSQQLSLNGDQRNQSSQQKQAQMLKLQNQSLKSKIKNLEQKLSQNSFLEQNSMNKSNISVVTKSQQSTKQMDSLKNILVAKQSQIQQKNLIIEQLKQQVEQLNKQKSQQQSQISSLKKQFSENLQNKKQIKQQEQTFQLLQEKFNQMNKQTGELVSELQHAKQVQKKNLLKIQNLEKQLQKMIALQQRNIKGATSHNTGSKNVIVSRMNNHTRQLNSSRKSLSQKSFGSQRSQKSHSNASNKKKPTNIQAVLKNYNNNSRLNQNRLHSSSRRSSVYDSDTQSSKLRRANNNRVSPFRQGTGKPLPKQQKSISSKKSGRNNFTSTMNNRFERNILANQKDRRRSKSRSVKGQNSPPAQIPTDNFASSSDDQRCITEALTKLKQRKTQNQVNLSKNSKQTKRQDKMGMGLQKKITNIAQMLRNAKSRDRNN